jgi:GAF domain-containing protein/HAMP domain-containing protein
MDIGWGVIVQRQTTQLQTSLRLWRRITGIALFASGGLLGILISLTVGQALSPIRALTEHAVAVSEGGLDRTVPIESNDEFAVLARAFNSMTAQLRDLIAGLEQRVRERTLDLERRSRYLEVTAEVAGFAASILDPDDLAKRVTELIRDRFGLYYVGLFLRDDSGDWAVLVAGTGDAGEQMLAAGHRLRMGGASMIGQCVDTGEAGVHLGIQDTAIRFDNPLLPNTRSELALPMRSRGIVIGAMTVQSEREAAFDMASIAVLQTMVDQVALAVENARLISQSTAALEAARRASGELTRQAWTELLRSRDSWGYRYSGGRIGLTASGWPTEMVQAVETEQIVPSAEPDEPGVETGGRGMLAIPLKVRGQTVGAVGFRKPGVESIWSDHEVEVLEMLVQQLGDTLVGAQLYAAAQDNAARQRLVGELASRMRQTLDVESVLRTTVQEVRHVLDLPEVSVRLRVPSHTSSREPETRPRG